MRLSLWTASLLLVALLPAREAAAYRYYKCWTGAKLNWASEHTRFDADADTFPPGGGAALAIQRAIDAVNAAPADHSVAFHLDPDELVGFGNLESEVYFAEIDRPAECMWQADLAFSCYLTEADVRINATLWADGFYSTGQAKKPHEVYGGGPRLLESDMVHELGHCVGMQHESRVYSVMGESSSHLHTNGSVARTYAGVDLTRGLRFLYGGVDKGANLAVTHWKWVGETTPGCTGGNDCYSEHGRTELRRVPEDELLIADAPPKAWSGGEPVYSLIRGQRVLVEFGFENLGEAPTTTLVELVVSPDDTITTADPATLGAPVSLSLDGVSSHYPALTAELPPNLPGGKHFLGAIVDPADDLAEADEADNATYVAIQVLDPTKPTGLTQSVPPGATVPMTLDPATGWATMSPITLGAVVGGYAAPFEVGACRVNFFVERTGVAPNVKLPTISSPFGSPGSTRSVTLYALAPGAYRWWAQTQCENESVGFGSALVPRAKGGTDFAVTAPPLAAKALLPAVPFGLAVALFPATSDDPLWVDGSVELSATSFDLNGDPLTLEFLVLRHEDEDGAPVGPEVVASPKLAAAGSGAVDLRASATFAFEVEAGSYQWSVRACDPKGCSAFAIGEGFEVQGPALDDACSPGRAWCNAEFPGYFFEARPVIGGPLPPDPTPWLGAVAMTPAELLGAVSRVSRPIGTTLRAAVLRGRTPTVASVEVGPTRSPVGPGPRRELQAAHRTQR